ncbi:DUF6438 domain-containing protein [Parvularcula sp. LCG005]|uniref:DUF6438 domain-containing protein n=1 Tax=Parvularcula sp. LCG005 TaxID=3078805 RepID=UPI002941F19F|nr:DUF6438 domain-containing protein [Parvularcula sp. LCG005]WOI52640.1 DUF6438 domain-containing protein [Parvularcula sp. LCG005]
MKRILIAIAVLAAGCTAADSPSAPAADTRDGQIRYETTMCFGTCPVLDVMARMDGTVTFSGFRPRVSEGDAQVTETYQVDPAVLKQLVSDLEEGGFSALLDNYNGADVCPQLATDGPSKIVTVQAGSIDKRVNYYTHCWGFEDEAKVKAMLAEVERVLMIDEKTAAYLPTDR